MLQTIEFPYVALNINLFEGPLLLCDKSFTVFLKRRNDRCTNRNSIYCFNFDRIIFFSSFALNGCVNT
jgi:hypothetical protein